MEWTAHHRLPESVQELGVESPPFLSFDCAERSSLAGALNSAVEVDKPPQKNHSPMSGRIRLGVPHRAHQHRLLQAQGQQAVLQEPGTAGGVRVRTRTQVVNGEYEHPLF